MIFDRFLLIFFWIIVCLTIFYGYATYKQIRIKRFESAFSMLMMTLSFAVISYVLLSTLPSEITFARENAYNKTYETCHSKWNANDKMRNSALLIVQIQFQRLGSLSHAPKESYAAINIICDIEAKEARAAVKGSEDSFIMKIFPYHPNK